MGKVKGSSHSSKSSLIKATNNRKKLRDPSLVDPSNRKELEPYRGGRFPNFEKEVYFCIDQIKLGATPKQLREVLEAKINTNTGRVYSPKLVTQILVASKSLVDLYYKQVVYKGEKLHVVRYNKIIAELMNKDYSRYNHRPALQREVMAQDLENVLKALLQKETLLGMRRESFRVVINNQINIMKREQDLSQVREERGEIEVENLEFEEQLELLELLKKCRRSENEVTGIILREKKEVVEEDVVDVEYEEVSNTSIMESYKKQETDNSGTTLSKLQKKLLEKSKRVDE